jgi:hypothetical protein
LTFGPPVGAIARGESIGTLRLRNEEEELALVFGWEIAEAYPVNAESTTIDQQHTLVGVVVVGKLLKTIR